MSIERIKKAIDIINYAIKNNCFLTTASEHFGYSSTYVKNVKRDVLRNKNSGSLSKEISDFLNTYENYLSFNGKTQVDKNDVDISKPVLGEKFEVSQNENTLNVEWKGQDLFNESSTSSSDNSDEEDYNDSEQHYGYPPNHIKTLDALLSRCNVDLDKWQVVRHIVNKWDVTSWKLGHPQTWENFQVKATLERIKEVQSADKLEELLNNIVKNFNAPTVNANIIPTNFQPVENNLLEISLFDLHIGKLGWSGEVGENYDTRIAKNRFMDALDNLLLRAKGFQYSKILFPIGNDFFNSDNQFNTTAGGTPQDEDLRWQKTWDLACELIIEAITKLKATGVPIDVIVIPGNHDWERSKFLGTVVQAWFRNDKQINVNNNAKPRKYYKFGEVLLGFTHGKYEKENSLPLLMATEEKELWGETTFHEWHLGHFHKKRNLKFTVFDKAQVLNEELGVTVRYLSSLSGLEEWHYKKGYIGTQKAGEAFIWNDKSGMIGHINFNFTDFDRED